MSRRVALVLLAWLSCPAAGRCGDAPTPDPSPSAPAPEPHVEPSLETFVRSHPDCLELGDGCLVCRVVEGEARCSTPGIACQPEPLACLVPR